MESQRIGDAAAVARLMPAETSGVQALLAGPDHPRRADLEAFVEDRFESAFGASLTLHHPLIAALMASDGAILCACGLRFADEAPLFLERYLDQPVEELLEDAFGERPRRSEIVEIGSFASVHPRWSLDLIERLPPWLAAAAGRRFAVATLRPDLCRLLGRAGFGLRRLGRADPGRLGEGAGAWGRYYDAAPEVLAGRIAGGAALSVMRERLSMRTAQRLSRRVQEACA